MFTSDTQHKGNYGYYSQLNEATAKTQLIGIQQESRFYMLHTIM
jgi:hypothetical protein